MTNYEDDEEEGFEIEELNDSDFADEHGESASCVVQRLLATRRSLTLRNDIKSFIQGFLFKSKVCNLIIDNGSCENIVYRALVDYLKLERKPPHHPYTISWIKKGQSIKVTWLDQEGPLYQGNKFMSCSYFNWQVLSRFLLHVMWLIWMHVIFF